MTKISLKNRLAITDSNTFGYKNKIDKLKYINIKDLVNNIKNNTISEISAKKSLDTLNEIENAEIVKYKKHTPGQKKIIKFIQRFIRYNFN